MVDPYLGDDDYKMTRQEADRDNLQCDIVEQQLHDLQFNGNKKTRTGNAQSIILKLRKELDAFLSLPTIVSLGSFMGSSRPRH